MRIQLLPSVLSSGLDCRYQFLTSYLVNDCVAIDAGSLGIGLSLARQRHIKHVVLSHSHIDHIGMLPIFLENGDGPAATRVTIHGSEAVLEALHRHVFNDCMWPDLTRVTVNSEPLFRLSVLEPEQTLEIEGIRITSVPIDHVVPTMGFLVDEGGATVVLATDTGPTEAIWRRANAQHNLQAVFLEASFPDSMSELARLSKHLTPALFGNEIRKLARPVRAIAVHIKAPFYDQVVGELHALNIPGLEIAEPGKEYRF